MKKAKQFFNVAMKYRKLTENPFRGLSGKMVRVESRQHFVTRQDADKVLRKCPDVETRLIFALCRYGGLRNPSETLNLRWENIDWERSRMLVLSPKTEGHEGGESRWVPIFPELRGHLDAAYFARGDEGAVYCIEQYRSQDKNMRTRFRKIIERAGLKPWPRLFHNLRATRQTELLDEYPIHVVCAWIGNSQPVAIEHYATVTDAHFERATKAQRKAQQHGVEQR